MLESGHPPAARAAQSERVLPWLLLGYAALVIYLTTYPWNFDFVRPGQLLTLRLAPGRASIIDVVLNFLLLMPLGFLAAVIWRNSWKAWMVVPAGFLLSAGVEITQAFIPGRTSSAIDLAVNSLGCAVAALVGQFAVTWRSGSRQRQNQRSGLPHVVDFRCLWLLLVFVIGLYFPFIPSYRLSQLKLAWDKLLTVPQPLELLTAFVTVTLVATALRHITRPVLSRTTIFGFALALLAAGFFFPGRIWPLLSIAAGLLGAGFALWPSAEKSTTWIPLVAVLYLCVRQLSPFDFSAASQQFSWVPFASVLQIPQSSAVRIVAEKLFVYAATLLMLWRYVGLLWPCTLLCATLLALGEWAQLWLPGRVPDILDPLLVLVAALLLRLLPGTPIRGVYSSGWTPASP